MTPFTLRATRVARALSGASLLASCSHGAGAELPPDQPVRIAPAPSSVQYGDCVEARRRAAEKPELGAIARWKFEPALLAGCKVARTYKWGATSGGG